MRRFIEVETVRVQWNSHREDLPTSWWQAQQYRYVNDPATVHPTGHALLPLEDVMLIKTDSEGLSAWVQTEDRALRISLASYEMLRKLVVTE